MKLGRFIGGGSYGSVYELAGSNPEEVIKICDTRRSTGTYDAVADNKSKRNNDKKLFEQEIANLEKVQTCELVIPLSWSRTYYPVKGDPSIAIYFLVMPKLIPLLEFHEEHPLTEDDLVQLALDIGTALQACARQEIIHRDVKPMNILVTCRQGKYRFVLTDFGISRSLEELGEKIAPVTSRGTPYYYAPEISNHKRLIYRYAPDLYSLGVTLYNLLCNHSYKYYPAYDADWTQLRPIEGISKEFHKIIEKLLQPNAEYRYHHPDELLVDLNRLIPHRRKHVLPRRYSLAAREHMLSDHYAEAIDAAKAGIENGEPDCIRILAYCMAHQEHASPTVLEKAIKLLGSQCFNGVPESIFLRGMFHLRAHRWEDYLIDMRDAIEYGNVPACYYYGRALYDGKVPGCPRDREQGIVYIQKAAEKDFYPALRILKRHCDKYHDMNLEDDLKAKLEKNYPKNDPMEQRAYITYL